MERQKTAGDELPVPQIVPRVDWELLLHCRKRLIKPHRREDKAGSRIHRSPQINNYQLILTSCIDCAEPCTMVNFSFLYSMVLSTAGISPAFSNKNPARLE